MNRKIRHEILVVHPILYFYPTLIISMIFWILTEFVYPTHLRTFGILFTFITLANLLLVLNDYPRKDCFILLVSFGIFTLATFGLFPSHCFHIPANCYLLWGILLLPMMLKELWVSFVHRKWIFEEKSAMQWNCNKLLSMPGPEIHHIEQIYFEIPCYAKYILLGGATLYVEAGSTKISFSISRINYHWQKLQEYALC